LLGTMTADGAGNWSFTTGVLSDGTHTFTASSTDALGNTSPASNAYAVTVDTFLATPTLNSLTTASPSPAISGTFDSADATGLTITVNGVTYVLGLSPALTAGGNSWSLDLALAGQVLAPGSYGVVVGVTDAAGNSASNFSAGLLTVTSPSTNSAPVMVPFTQEPTSVAVAERAALAPLVVVPASDSGDGAGRLGFTSSADTSGGPSGAARLALRLPVDPDVPQSDFAKLGRHVQPASDPIGLGTAVHWLYVYHGVPDFRLFSDGALAVKVPVDAFAHTDPAAIIGLEARLANGLPLPEWLSFNTVTKQFTGVPRDAQAAELQVEVIARDKDGREARTTFQLSIEAVKVQERSVAEAAKDLRLGLSVDKEEAEKARAGADKQTTTVGKEIKATGKGKPTPRGAATFSEQLRAVKGSRDPLLEKITPASPQRTAGPR
jgi:hypothetical protein